MRRVVVTGTGLVSPLGAGIEPVWRRLIAGESGAGPIEQFDTSSLPCKIACPVPRVDGSGGGAKLIKNGAGDAAFNPDDWMEPREQRRVNDFILYGMAAAQMAFSDSGLDLKTAEERERAGVMTGSGIGGLSGIESEVLVMNEKGPRRVSPFFITGNLINLVSGQVSIKLGLKGPNLSLIHI